MDLRKIWAHSVVPCLAYSWWSETVNMGGGKTKLRGRATELWNYGEQQRIEGDERDEGRDRGRDGNEWRSRAQHLDYSDGMCVGMRYQNINDDRRIYVGQKQSWTITKT